MALAITAGKGFEFSITRSSIYFEVGGLFSFFASVERLKGAPRWSLERAMDGKGGSVRLGRLSAQLCTSPS